MATTRKPRLNTDQLRKGILAGERSVLAQAITIAESTLEVDRLITEQLVEQLLPNTGKSIRIGITGVPGVGKSTFIEVFGELLTGQGRKVGVLTVDPSSEKSKGSILGDKTRMEQLSKNPKVFIRPSPSNLALGGVTHHTRESVLLCEAAGFDVILIETVGVGQSETYVRNMVDFFLLMTLAGAGDELQGIKKGIMEMADGVVITKSERENIKASVQAMADTRNAIHLLASPASAWKPKVLAISALENKGIKEVWEMILEYQKHVQSSGYFEENRRLQKKKWLEECLESYFREYVNGKSFKDKKEKVLEKVMKDTLLPTDAARQLWNSLIKKRNLTAKT